MAWGERALNGDYTNMEYLFTFHDFSAKLINYDIATPLVYTLGFPNILLTLSHIVFYGKFKLFIQQCICKYRWEGKCFAYFY